LHLTKSPDNAAAIYDRPNCLFIIEWNEVRVKC
jgi:hypothetical protein